MANVQTSHRQKAAGTTLESLIGSLCTLPAEYGRSSVRKKIGDLGLVLLLKVKHLFKVVAKRASNDGIMEIFLEDRKHYCGQPVHPPKA